MRPRSGVQCRRTRLGSSNMPRRSSSSAQCEWVLHRSFVPPPKVGVGTAAVGGG
jgi:hypothetical protein